MKELYWKVLRQNQSDYLRVLFGGTFIIAMVFFSTAVGGCLSYVEEGKAPGLTYLLLEVEREFLIPYILLLVLLVLFVTEYIRKRFACYEMLMVLGISSKHKHRFVAKEYLGIIFGSVFGGLLVGSAGAELIKMLLERIFMEEQMQIHYGWSPLILTLIMSALGFGLNFMICDLMITWVGTDQLTGTKRKNDQVILTHKSLKFIIAAIVAVDLLVVSSYWGKIGYVVPTVLAVAAVFLFLYFVVGAWVKSLKEKDGYYKKVLFLDDWICHFYHRVNTAVVVGAFLFIICFTFGSILIDHYPLHFPGNYPYDLVWGANRTDQEFLHQLEAEKKAQITAIPCMRVTSGDKAEHTGISASEYEKWTGEHIELNSGEIFVVHQRDKSEQGNLGLDYGRKIPRIYMGCSEGSIWVFTLEIVPGNLFTRDHRVVGTKEQVLTGDFESRQYRESGLRSEEFEDIVIFSDEDYAKVSKGAKGSDLLVMMQITGDYDAVVEEVTAYAKEHSQVNFFDYQHGNLIYEKQQQLRDEKHGKMLKVTAMLLNIISCMVCVLFILYENVESNKEVLRWKYTFYYHLGMSDEERKKLTYREIFFTGKIALLSGLPLAVLLMTEKFLFKRLTKEWLMIYLGEMAALVCLVAAVVWIAMYLIASRTYRQIERGIQSER